MGLPRAPTSIYDALGTNVLKVNPDGSINVSGGGGGGPVDITVPEGANFASAFTSPGGTLVTALVLPIANINGLIIRRGFVGSYGAVNSALMAKATTPTDPADTGARGLLLTPGISGTSIVSNLALPLKIPAGLGLYFVGNGSTAGTSYYIYSASWDLL